MYIGSWALALQSLSVLPLFESEPLLPLIGYGPSWSLICSLELVLLDLIGFLS